jgi:hypothetical protein
MESIKSAPNPTPKQVTKGLQEITRATQRDKQLEMELEAKRMGLPIEEYKLYSNFTELIDKWQKTHSEESQKGEEQISEKVEIKNNTPIEFERSFLSYILREIYENLVYKEKQIDVLDDFHDIFKIEIKKIGDEDKLIQFDVSANKKHILRSHTKSIIFNLNSQGKILPRIFEK